VTPGQRHPILENPASPYGATAITGPEGNRPLGAAETEEARALGQRVAEVALLLHWGREEWENQYIARMPAALTRDAAFDPSA
jgi:hypothetical protein